MELRKCHLFFNCGTMKFFLFLLFLLLLFDSPQGSAISHKRSIRALNTTLETNFNGTYQRRNPCNNGETETTSYVATHEFRHHSEENNWNDYTNKCSSIINSFLQALGNLVHFNHKQNGIFNFHINTSISQKHDPCEPGKRTSCETFPTITIEASDYKLSPRLPCRDLSVEQLDPKSTGKFIGNKEIKHAICADSLNQEIYQRKKVPSEKTSRTHNFNQNPAINTPQYRTENEITQMPFLGATAVEVEAENARNMNNIFLPASLESKFPTASTLMETKNSPERIIDPPESAQTNFQIEQYSEFLEPYDTRTSQFDPEKYSLFKRTEPRTLAGPRKLLPKASESFNEQSSSHPQSLPKVSYFDPKTTRKPIADEEPFDPNQFSDQLFREKQLTDDSKQHFYDNLNEQVSDSEFLPNLRPENSFFSPDQILKAPFTPQESIPTETYEPKNTGFDVNPSSLPQQFPNAIEQNEESFQQSLQSRKQPDNLEETQSWSNTDISFETKTTPYSFQKYLTKSDEAPVNQIENAEPPQVPNLMPNERQFMNYDDQTAPLSFSASYPTSPARSPPVQNIPGNKFAEQESDWLQKTTQKKRVQAVDYPDKFFKAQPLSEGTSDSLTLDDTSDDLSTFTIRKSPVLDPVIWTPNERSSIKKPLFDVGDNQFVSTPSPELPPFYSTSEPPFLTSESQKSASYYSHENFNESNTDEATATELSFPSDQYQLTTSPESQSFLNYPDQYDKAEKAKPVPESNFFDPLVQHDFELTTDKPYLQSYPAIAENQDNGFVPFGARAFPPRYPTDTVSNQKFSSSYDSTSDYDSFSSSEGETFSDEYLTTLSPEQDSFEKSQQILTTFDPYQSQPNFQKTPFFSALEEKSTSTSPGQILNKDVVSSTLDASTLNSEQPSNEIYFPRTPALTSDDYQDSLYPKPDTEPSFTTPVKHFNEYNYEPATESYFTDDKKTYSDEAQPTTLTITSIDPLKQKSPPRSNPNSNPILEQSLKYDSNTLLPVQNYNVHKYQSQQLFEKSKDLLPDVNPFSDQQYNDFSIQSSKSESSMNSDSEIPPDSFALEMEQYPDDTVAISDQSKQNPDITPYYAENFPEENSNKRLFSDRSSFEKLESTFSDDFSTADDDSVPVKINNDQKLDFPAEFLGDSDSRSKEFFPQLHATPLPATDFPSEDFSSPPSYKIKSGHFAAQGQVGASNLNGFVRDNFAPKLGQPAFSASSRDVNKFYSDFQTTKNLKHPFEPATIKEKPTQSTISAYENHRSQPFSYSNAADSVTPYAEKNYVAVGSPRVPTHFIPKPKSVPKRLTSNIREHNSTTSSTEVPTKFELFDYGLSNSGNSVRHPAVDQQTRGTTYRESSPNYSNQFSDFYSNEPSAVFLPSVKRPLVQNSPDLHKKQTEFFLNNRQPNSAVFEPQSLITTVGDDQFHSSEFQSFSTPKPEFSTSKPELALSFSDDTPSSIFPEKIPLDIPSQTNPLALPKNQELQSNDFQTQDSMTLAPYIQPQISSVAKYSLEDFSKDSQSSLIEDLDSVIPPESRPTKPETYRNINQVPNRQSAAKFNAFQPPQRGTETYRHFSSTAPLQSPKFNEEAVPNSDYSSTLKYASQIEPTVDNYNRDVFKPYSKPNFELKPQSYQYQPELSPQTEEYSDITPTAETEKSFNIDETIAPSVPEVSPLHVSESKETQSIQDKISDYPFSFAPEQQSKPQPSYDFSSDVLDENMVEKLVPSALQNSNFKNIPFSKVKPDKSEASNLYTDYTEVYEQDDLNNDYKQPESTGSYYRDESLDQSFNMPNSALSNPTQSSFASPPPDSVPNVQLKPNDFMSFSQTPATTFKQLNNNLNEPSQQSSTIPPRYPQSEKEISFVTDNISPQSRPTTAVYIDEEIAEKLPISKLQLQTTMNLVDKFSDDNIPEKLSNFPDVQYQITSDATLSSKPEPVPSMSFPFVSTQRNAAEFDNFDIEARDKPTFLYESKTQPLDMMSGSLDQTQNNFDPKLSSQAYNTSSLYKATTAQSQRQSLTTKPVKMYNSQEQFPSYDQLASQPIMNSNHKPILMEYEEEVYDQFSPNNPPLEPKNFNEASSFSEPKRVTASRYGQRTLNSKETFQTQPYVTRSSRYPISDPPIISDKNRLPSIESRHSATQGFNPQPYPTNSTNQYPNYNARTRLNAPISNSYNNELARQSNRASPEYFTSDAVQAENSFESPLKFNLDHNSKRSDFEQSPDQTIKNADSPSYDDYDQVLSSRLPNEKLLEYDEDITPNTYAENSPKGQTHRLQGKDIIEEDPREDSGDYLIESDTPLEYNQKADSYGFQDRSSPNDKPPSYLSYPVEKEPHLNPLLQTLKSHLTLPFQGQLRPSASYASFTDTEKETLNDSFSFDLQNQNEFRDSSAVRPYSERRDFVNYQRSQPLNRVLTAQDDTNTLQPDSHVLVSDPNIPSNKPGEDCVSGSGQNPDFPYLCPFDPILKGNMTAPSYYILISKMPVDDDKEEQFKVEKVYLGDGMPLNCTLSIGKTFPALKYTSIPFSATGTVKLRTKSDFS